jgi:predicted NBD/HSP70 family sugar kinase
LPSEAAGSQQVLKHINRMSLVRHLCVHPGRSRAELAQEVGLTKSTVSLLVRELIDEGWLLEREVVATGELGRRPTPLLIDGRRQLLVGADVGVAGVRVVATSLTGEVLARADSSYGAGRTAKLAVAALATALAKVERQLEDRGHRAIGLGIGLPGGVSEDRGYLHYAPNLGWRDVPFRELLVDKLAGTGLAAVPLFLLNGADAAALGEHEFNPRPDADPLIHVVVSDGVGAGIVVDDLLLTGHRGFAGEVGHIVLQRGGPPCSCGRRGCAEALIGPRAMLRRGEPGPLPVAEVQRRLQEGDAGTVRAVRRAGGWLGVLLHNLATSYDPGCIVLGGPLVGLGDVFLRPALNTLQAYSADAGLAPPQVQLARFGDDALAVGAAALVRYRITRPRIATTAITPPPEPRD